MPTITQVNTDDTVQSGSVGNSAVGTDLSRAQQGNIADSNDISLPITGLVVTETEVEFDYADPISVDQRFGTATLTIDSNPTDPVSLSASLVPSAPASPINFTAALGGPNNIFMSATPGSWVQAPNTRMEDVLPPESFMQPWMAGGSAQKIITAWNGMAFDSLRDHCDLFCNGGHFDYHGNEYLRFDLNTLQWSLIQGPSDLTGWNQSTGKYDDYVAPPGATFGDGMGVYNDGRPACIHSYQGHMYHVGRDEYIMAGGSLASGAGVASDRWWSVPTNRDATNPPDYTLLRGNGSFASLGYSLIEDPNDGDIFNSYSGVVFKFDFATKSIRFVTNTLPTNGRWGQTAALDTSRNNMLIIGHWDGGSGVTRGAVFNIVTESYQYLDFTGDLSILQDPGLGVQYVPSKDMFYIFSGNSTTEIYTVDPVTWRITPVAATGLAPSGPNTGMYGRFAYSPNFDGFVTITGWRQDVSFYKLPL